MKAGTLVLLMLVVGVPILAGLGLTLVEAADPAAWTTLWNFPGLGRSLALSVWTGMAATCVALLVAHLSVAMASTRTAALRLRFATLPIIALPHLAIAIGLALTLSPSGLLLRLLSPWATGFARPPDWLTIQDPLGLALITGLVIKETPFLVLMLLGARAQVPVDRLTLQARSLGYRPLKAWWVAVAPLLGRQIRLPLAAVAVFGMTNVEMAIPLAPMTPPPFAVVLWQWFTASRLELRAAAFAGSVVLLVVVVSALAVGGWAMRGARERFAAYATSGERGSRSRGMQIGLGVAPAVSAVLAFAAIAALALRSLSPMWRFPAVFGAPTADLIGRVTPVLGATFAPTLALASATALGALALVLVAVEGLADDVAWRRRVGVLLFVPLLLPQLAFLFGLQWLLVRLRLDGTWGAVAWEHLLFALPYAWAILVAARVSLDPRLLLTARSLGARPLRVWAEVSLPLLARSLLLAGAVAFAVSVALYLPTLFAGGGRIMTLATEAASAAASGSLRIAAIHGTAQALLPLAALLLSTFISRMIHHHRRGVPA